MATATKTEPIESTTGIPDEDIVDRVVPPEALASPPEPTLQQMRDDLGCLARVVDAGLNRLPAVFAQHLEALVTQVGALAQLTQAQGSLTAPEAGALQCLIEALETMGARGFMITKPYTATIQARTPGGFSMQVSIERIDCKDFLAALTGMEGWLTQSGYTPVL